jgi:hypothetical protein
MEDKLAKLDGSAGAPAKNRVLFADMDWHDETIAHSGQAAAHSSQAAAHSSQEDRCSQAPSIPSSVQGVGCRV